LVALCTTLGDRHDRAPGVANELVPFPTALASRFQFPKGKDQACAKANNKQDKAERLRNISHRLRAVRNADRNGAPASDHSETCTSLAVNDLNRSAEFDENSPAVEFFIVVSEIDFLKFKNLKNAIVEPSGFNSRVRRRIVWLASHLPAKLGRQIAAHSFELCWLHHAIKRR
jgi:hypothetical protein